MDVEIWSKYKVNRWTDDRSESRPKVYIYGPPIVPFSPPTTAAPWISLQCLWLLAALLSLAPQALLVMRRPILFSLAFHERTYPSPLPPVLSLPLSWSLSPAPLNFLTKATIIPIVLVRYSSPIFECQTHSDQFRHPKSLN